LTKVTKAISIALLSAVALAACGNNPDTGDGGNGSGLSGTVNADGSSTVFPIMEAVAEDFKAANPGVDITVGESGTGGGFEKFCSGETDISNASRPIKEDDEAPVCKENGIEYVELEVAQDGLAVVVHPSNDWVDCLTTEELSQIWEPESSVDSWDDIRSDFPAEELTLFGPGTDSGTFDYFTDVINGEEGASRSDYTASENDNVLVQGVADDKGALGYFGYAYYAQNSDKLKVLGVDAGDGCVVPEDATVQDGTYTPLSRPLYVYVKVASLEKAEVAAFVEFMLDNVQTLSAEVGYTPLSDEELAQAVSAYESAA
jgi:phosphate transport system substrate-binding protein